MGIDTHQLGPRNITWPDKFSGDQNVPDVMEKVSDLPTDPEAILGFSPKKLSNRMASSAAKNAARWGFLLLKLEKTEPEMMQDTLWWTNSLLWKMAINSGFSYEKWWCSIAMLVHQRVVDWRLTKKDSGSIYIHRDMRIFLHTERHATLA